MTPQHAAPVHAAGAVATTDAIRQQFPALAREHRGRHVAYFDGPGGTQVPRQVTEAMTDYLLHHNANTHWDYPSSHETDAAIEAARQAAADLLNASPAEIVFGQNMTTLTLHLARALGRGWGPGDELIVTELDHHANVDTWRTLEAERGVTVRMAPMDAATGTLVWSDLERLVSTRTRLLAIGAASNALGTINDLARAASAAKAAGALLFVDAVHYAAHASIDVQAIGCDFLACSAYKFYGPHVGLLYGRRALLESLPVAKLDPAPDTAPERLETGTQNHEGIVGLRAAIDFLASLGPAPTRRASLVGVMHELDRRGQVLLARLWDGLSRIPAVTLFGQPPGEARTPTLSFVVAGHPSADVARRLADSAVFVSHGDFYATTLVRRLGHAQDGVVRLGCACYTTEEEIERVLAAVAALAP
jgi:cysteine desulfurase family protein (TIGR01976 family)